MDLAPLLQYVKSVVDNTLTDLHNENSIAFAFWFSAILLSIISIMKNMIGKHCDKWGFWGFLLEFPIDVCSIVISVIFTVYMHNVNRPFGLILAGLSILVALICCFFRQSALKYFYDEKISIKMLVWGILDIFTATIWILIVYCNLI